MDRALYPWTCGTHVDTSPAAGLAALSARAGLMAQASYFRHTTETACPSRLNSLDSADLDRYGRRRGCRF